MTRQAKDDPRGSLDHTLEQIAASPELYPAIYRDTRRSLLHRFPYTVFYRTIEDEAVVIACLHVSRAPRTWQARR